MYLKIFICRYDYHRDSFSFFFAKDPWQLFSRLKSEDHLFFFWSKNKPAAAERALHGPPEAAAIYQGDVSEIITISDHNPILENLGHLGLSFFTYSKIEHMLGISDTF